MTNNDLSALNEAVKIDINSSEKERAETNEEVQKKAAINPKKYSQLIKHYNHLRQITDKVIDYKLVIPCTSPGIKTIGNHPI